MVPSGITHNIIYIYITFYTHRLGWAKVIVFCLQTTIMCGRRNSYRPGLDKPAKAVAVVGELPGRRPRLSLPGNSQESEPSGNYAVHAYSAKETGSVQLGGYIKMDRT